MRKSSAARSRDFLTRVYHRSSNVVARKIADEFILVPIMEEVSDKDAIYTLNAVGAELWERLDGKKNLRQIARELVKKYEVNRSVVEADIRRFIKVLEKIGVVRWG